MVHVSTVGNDPLSTQIPTLRAIVEQEGQSALWRGVRPRMLFHIPAAAICYGTYETFKGVLLPGDDAPLARQLH